jgi:hypothetical protein
LATCGESGRRRRQSKPFGDALRLLVGRLRFGDERLEDIESRQDGVGLLRRAAAARASGRCGCVTILRECRHAPPVTD